MMDLLRVLPAKPMPVHSGRCRRTLRPQRSGRRAWLITPLVASAVLSVRTSWAVNGDVVANGGMTVLVAALLLIAVGLLFRLPSLLSLVCGCVTPLYLDAGCVAAGRNRQMGKNVNMLRSVVAARRPASWNRYNKRKCPINCGMLVDGAMAKVIRAVSILTNWAMSHCWVFASGGGRAVRHHVTDICDGWGQEPRWDELHLASREAIASFMVEIRTSVVPYDAGHSRSPAAINLSPAHLIAPPQTCRCCHIPGGSMRPAPNMSTS